MIKNGLECYRDLVSHYIHPHLPDSYGVNTFEKNKRNKKGLGALEIVKIESTKIRKKGEENPGDWLSLDSLTNQPNI